MKLKWKAIISTVLIFSLAAATVTGVLLFFFKGGMIGCCPRKYINDVHAISGFVMCGAGLLHLTLNWSVFRTEWKKWKE